MSSFEDETSIKLVIIIIYHHYHLTSSITHIIIVFKSCIKSLIVFVHEYCIYYILYMHFILKFSLAYFQIVKYWPEKGKSGFLVWRYLFRRDDPAPAPWTKEGKKRIAELGLTMQVIISCILSISIVLD